MAVTRSLFVVTHPEARHHLEARVGGWHDSELTVRGELHAGLIAAELRSRIPSTASAQVFTSDLRRTRTTAGVIADLLCSRAIELRGLREKSYGVAEGRAQSWLDERYAFPPVPEDAFDHAARLDHFEGIDGSETRREAGARIYAAVDEILRQQASHQVVVTHGFAHTFVIARWLELPLEAMGRATFAARSGCITELTEDDLFGNRTLHSLAAVDHLGDS
ncbi:probable phosphoglycerate mutase [Brevibacterium siliguriense]|uniref:Probable phosphoglycerate mutase n=1 Tax=Brevibacterium siliguriense TaxID=1136497 RepID=A0A1H1X4J8_9MICO|nr:histidine phosphatase family protein [Brevibacterium siliguriense]SDT04198.1 probable phosphoglycerate mutase [Brevibacterium siliguriense]